MQRYQKISIIFLVGLVFLLTIQLSGLVMVRSTQGEDLHISAGRTNFLIWREPTEDEIKKEEACKEKNEFFNQATEISTCNSGSQWWDENQIEGTIDSIMACLQNKILEESGTRAHGIITVYNQYSPEPQLIIASTRFESPDGKMFRTQEKIMVPGAQSNDVRTIPGTIDVEVMTDYHGAEYNIGPSNFAIPGFEGTDKYKLFYGLSNAAMTGGSNIAVEDTDLKIEYQNQLKKLDTLNVQFKVAEIVCEG